MAARSKARKRALDLLYEADVRGEPVLELLDQRIADASPPVSPYAAGLVRGVQVHRERIDTLLATHAVEWTLDRMPAVDRNVLRIGAYELLWADDIPDGVAISEAVALARDLSTEASPSFVNGLLARLLELKPTLPDFSELRPSGSDPDMLEIDQPPEPARIAIADEPARAAVADEPARTTALGEPARTTALGEPARTTALDEE
jgi:N utilization substance protein B